MGERYAARVECQDCGFTAVIRPGEDRLPADVVVEHGRASGHKLSVQAVEEGAVETTGAGTTQG